MDYFLSQVFDIILRLVVPFGPAAYILARWNASEDKISSDTVKAVLAWTVLMLFFAASREIDNKNHLDEVCSDLKRALTEKHSDAAVASDEWNVWCHPEDYETGSED
jgi:hypothetical protein